MSHGRSPPLTAIVPPVSSSTMGQFKGGLNPALGGLLAKMTFHCSEPQYCADYTCEYKYTGISPDAWIFSECMNTLAHLRTLTELVTFSIYNVKLLIKASG